MKYFCLACSKTLTSEILQKQIKSAGKTENVRTLKLGFSENQKLPHLLIKTPTEVFGGFCAVVPLFRCSVVPAQSVVLCCSGSRCFTNMPF